MPWARYSVAALVSVHALWLALNAVGLVEPLVRFSLRLKHFPALDAGMASLGIALLLLLAGGLQLATALRLARRQDRVLVYWFAGFVANAVALMWWWLAAMAAREMITEVLAGNTYGVELPDGIELSDLKPPVPRQYLGLVYPAILSVLVWWASRRKPA